MGTDRLGVEGYAAFKPSWQTAQPLSFWSDLDPLLSGYETFQGMSSNLQNREVNI